MKYLFTLHVSRMFGINLRMNSRESFYDYLDTIDTYLDTDYLDTIRGVSVGVGRAGPLLFL